MTVSSLKKLPSFIGNFLHSSCSQLFCLFKRILKFVLPFYKPPVVFGDRIKGLILRRTGKLNFTYHNKHRLLWVVYPGAGVDKEKV